MEAQTVAGALPIPSPTTCGFETQKSGDPLGAWVADVTVQHSAVC